MSSAKGNGSDDNGARFTKGRKLSVVSDTHLAFDSNISTSQHSQPSYTQSPHLGLAAASPYQSDLKTNYLPKQLRRGATRSVCGKRPRTKARLGLASTAYTASAAFESGDLEVP